MTFIAAMDITLTIRSLSEPNLYQSHRRIMVLTRLKSPENLLTVSDIGAHERQDAQLPSSLATTRVAVGALHMCPNKTTETFSLLSIRPRGASLSAPFAPLQGRVELDLDGTYPRLHAKFRIATRPDGMSSFQWFASGERIPWTGELSSKKEALQ